MEYRDPATRERLIAIERIDLEIPEGQFVSIVGPSGCGKSTFLKIVNGLLPATEGEIEIRTARPRASDHAMVFQDSSLFPWYTRARQRRLRPGSARASRRRRRTSGRCRSSGWSGSRASSTKYPYQLSGGMQQRANLARALTVDPELLLMDEPFAALDAQTRELMQAELLRIWSTGAARRSLFITHQIDEAIFLSDRVLVMSARPGRSSPTSRSTCPRPRDLEIKRTPEFVAYEDQIWRLIARQLNTATAGAA